MEYSNPIQITELKADGDDWVVDGYVSTFNNLDLGGDVVIPGAFKDSLKGGPKVRFLLSHDPTMVLGVAKRLKEDSKGLFGSFKISKTKLGEDTRQLLLDGAIDSFSIGYQADDWKIVDGGTRELHKLTLYEASLVPIPMNPEAVVTRVKEYTTLAEQMRAYGEKLQALFDEIHGLSDKRPLNEQKRKELMELLETFSGLDDVRSNLQSVLTPQPSNLVDSHRVRHQLAELRSRRPDIFSKE